MVQPPAMSAEAKTPNAADPAKLQDQDRRRKVAEKQEDLDFVWLLDQAAGRRVLWRILGWCGVFTTSFTGNQVTYFNEGKRQIGLDLIGLISKLKPSALVQMMEESKKREEANNG
jgi:hypothetical protein